MSPGGDRTAQAVQGFRSTSRALPCARSCSQSLVLLLGFSSLLWVIHRQPLGLKGGHPAFWDRTRRLWLPRASQAWAASALPHPSAEGHGCCCLLPASLCARAAFSAWGGEKREEGQPRSGFSNAPPATCRPHLAVPVPGAELGQLAVLQGDFVSACCVSPARQISNPSVPGLPAALLTSSRLFARAL